MLRAFQEVSHLLVKSSLARIPSSQLPSIHKYITWLACPAIHSCGVPWCAAAEVLQLLSKGAVNRHVAATKANTDSSRSHCVFSCVLESKCTEEGVTTMRTSCLKLVDLAGSPPPFVTVLYQT